MKKFLSIICCLVVIAASSCTKQYVAPATTTNQTVYADLVSSNWSLFTDTDNKSSYQADITSTLLTSDFTSYGGVIVAFSYDGGTTYEQLPEVYNGISYSFTYNAGHLTLYAQSADGLTAVQPTLPIKVKVILVDSN